MKPEVEEALRRAAEFRRQLLGQLSSYDRHALSPREVPQRLPVPRPTTCVEEPVLAYYCPVDGVPDSAEHDVEVPAVPGAALSA